jgi:hypothetical protein
MIDKNGHALNIGDYVVYETHSLKGRQFGQIENISRFIITATGKERYNASVSGAEHMVSQDNIEFIG